MRPVNPPLDPLPVVCAPSPKGSSSGAGTILFTTPLERSKPVSL